MKFDAERGVRERAPSVSPSLCRTKRLAHADMASLYLPRWPGGSVGAGRAHSLAVSEQVQRIIDEDAQFVAFTVVGTRILGDAQGGRAQTDVEVLRRAALYLV